MSTNPLPTNLVQLLRHAPAPGDDRFVGFYTIVRLATGSLAFDRYSDFITAIFANAPASESQTVRNLVRNQQNQLSPNGSNHFGFVGDVAYEQIREATELFIACQASLIEDCCCGGNNCGDSN